MVSGLAAGIYTVTITDGEACTATASAQVFALPTVMITETDMSGTTNDDGIICAGDAATLTASGGTSYDWGSGASASGENIVSPTTTTTYTVTVTDAANNSCSTTATYEVIVNELPTAGITVTDASGTANDNIVCNGETATLMATGGTSYEWSTTETTASITVGDGTYIVTVTDSNGCEATTDVTITENPTITIAVAQLCDDSTLSLIHI